MKYFIFILIFLLSSQFSNAQVLTDGNFSVSGGVTSISGNTGDGNLNISGSGNPIGGTSSLDGTVVSGGIFTDNNTEDSGGSSNSSYISIIASNIVISVTQTGSTSISFETNKDTEPYLVYGISNLERVYYFSSFGEIHSGALGVLSPGTYAYRILMPSTTPNMVYATDIFEFTVSLSEAPIILSKVDLPTSPIYIPNQTSIFEAPIFEIPFEEVMLKSNKTKEQIPNIEIDLVNDKECLFLGFFSCRLAYITGFIFLIFLCFLLIKMGRENKNRVY